MGSLVWRRGDSTATAETAGNTAVADHLQTSSSPAVSHAKSQPGLPAQQASQPQAHDQGSAPWPPRKRPAPPHLGHTTRAPHLQSSQQQQQWQQPPHPQPQSHHPLRGLHSGAHPRPVAPPPGAATNATSASSHTSNAGNRPGLHSATATGRFGVQCAQRSPGAVQPPPAAGGSGPTPEQAAAAEAPAGPHSYYHAHPHSHPLKRPRYAPVLEPQGRSAPVAAGAVAGGTAVGPGPAGGAGGGGAKPAAAAGGVPRTSGSGSADGDVRPAAAQQRQKQQQQHPGGLQPQQPGDPGAALEELRRQVAAKEAAVRAKQAELAARQAAEHAKKAALQAEAEQRRAQLARGLASLAGAGGGVEGEAQQQPPQVRVAGPEDVRRVLGAPNDYAVLELQAGCTAVEVRRAYRRLAASLHPDKCGEAGAQDAFVRATAAYNALLRRSGG